MIQIISRIYDITMMLNWNKESLDIAYMQMPNALSSYLTKYFGYAIHIKLHYPLSLHWSRLILIEENLKKSCIAKICKVLQILLQHATIPMKIWWK